MEIQKLESTNFGRIIYEIQHPYNHLTKNQQSVKKLIEDTFCAQGIIQKLEDIGTDVKMVFQNDGNVLLRLSKKLQSLASNIKDTEYEPTASGFSKKIRALLEPITDNKSRTENKITEFVKMCLGYINNPNSARNARIENTWAKNVSNAGQNDFMITN